MRFTAHQYTRDTLLPNRIHWCSVCAQYTQTKVVYICTIVAAAAAVERTHTSQLYYDEFFLFVVDGTLLF